MKELGFDKPEWNHNGSMQPLDVYPVTKAEDPEETTVDADQEGKADDENRGGNLLAKLREAAPHHLRHEEDVLAELVSTTVRGGQHRVAGAYGLGAGAALAPGAEQIAVVAEAPTVYTANLAEVGQLSHM